MHILNGYSVMSLSWWQLNFNCGNEKHRCWKQMVGIGEVWHQWTTQASVCPVSVG